MQIRVNSHTFIDILRQIKDAINNVDESEQSCLLCHCLGGIAFIYLQFVEILDKENIQHFEGFVNVGMRHFYNIGPTDLMLEGQSIMLRRREYSYRLVRYNLYLILLIFIKSFLGVIFVSFNSNCSYTFF